MLGLLNSGCSFIFVTPPPAVAAQPAEPHADCSTSRAAPIVDGIIAGYQVVRTLYATQAPDSTYQGNAPISRGTDIALGVGFAGLFLASTIYGAVYTSQCQAYKARSEEADRAEKRERAKVNGAPGRRAQPGAVPEPEEKADSAAPPAPADSAAPPAPADSAAPPVPAVEAAPPAAAPLPFTSAPKSGGAFPP